MLGEDWGLGILIGFLELFFSTARVGLGFVESFGELVKGKLATARETQPSTLNPPFSTLNGTRGLQA